MPKRLARRTLMAIMNRKSLWTFFGWGAAVGVVAVVIFASFIAPRYYRNPAYAAYDSLHDRAADWFEANEDKLIQASLERAMVGLPPEMNLSGDWEVVATGLSKLRSWNDKNQSAIVSLLTRKGSDRFYPVLDKWHRCDREVCNFVKPIEFLNDPQKTARLLAGDVSMLTPDLPTNYPEEFKQLFDGTKVPPKNLTKPDWLGKANWLVFSLFCAIGFFLVGIGNFDKDYPGKPWSHPLRSVPDNIIGWAVITLFLPGYLAVQSVYWSIVLANSSMIPVIAKARSAFSKPVSFDDEFSDVERQLRGLEEKANGSGAQESLRKIQEALVRVQKNRSSAKLKEVSLAAEHLSDTVDGIALLNG
jgi:hypothetical protein